MNAYSKNPISKHNPIGYPSISSRAEVADRSSWSNSVEVYRSTINIPFIYNYDYPYCNYVTRFKHTPSYHPDNYPIL